MIRARHIKWPVFVTVGLCFCCLTALVGAQPSLDANGPSIRFFPEKYDYITWDWLRLYVEICPPREDTIVDMYLGLQLPDGKLLCLVPDLSFSGLMVEEGRLFEADWMAPSSLHPAARGLYIERDEMFPKTLVYRAILRHELALAEGEYWLFGLLCQAGAFRTISFSAESFSFEPQHCTVSGQIFDEKGPASSATVRMRATANEVLSDKDGRFCLEGVPCGKRLDVSGWKYEYYCTAGEVLTPTTGVVLTLDPIAAVDNEDYEWIPPTPSIFDHQFNCMKCQHPGFQQWANNFHARSASNVIFQTLYTGADIHGNPGRGPGYKLDFPNTAGSCALCHAPSAALESPYDSDMANLSPLGQQGVFCDFCHKIFDTDLSNLGTVYGINAIKLRRPFPDRWIVLGPIKDAGRISTFLPLMKRSEICAPCHACEFWGVPTYTSYPEWEASEYKEMGIQCQACHYRPDGITTNFAPLSQASERAPETIPSHLIMGEDNLSLHYQAATLSITASRGADNRLAATLAVFNAFAGHHLPTGRPIRNITLLVNAFDCQGNELEFLGEQIVPEYGGTGGGPRDFAGRPGKMFAKILVDMMGNHPAPSWRQTMILSDTRIPALESDFSTYEFILPESATCATVEAQLIYRRVFKDQADVKSLALEDILMTSESETFHFGGD
ncbi:MAG TPA: carboxypeptidase-like regulatory domain-containing protein [bacterium]|nr:carboxypeptidase-like regulatory domain-containing protein [bacterium]